MFLTRSLDRLPEIGKGKREHAKIGSTSIHHSHFTFVFFFFCRWKRLPADERSFYIKKANEQKLSYDKLLAQYKKTEPYAEYQKYLEEFYTHRPRAPLGRKRTYSDVNVTVESTPLTPPGKIFSIAFVFCVDESSKVYLFFNSSPGAKEATNFKPASLDGDRGTKPSHPDEERCGFFFFLLLLIFICSCF